MQTTHAVHARDARELSLPADSVDLVVTSPPYPMVEMWDESFAAQDPAIGEALDAEDGDRAFELMHDLLDEVWGRLPEVVRPGGIVCVNVGDATRSVEGFTQYPNAAEITRRMREHGFRPLPDILWRKPTNSRTKFMGSGMVPTNAYPTLEHEHILVFRNGTTRSFPAGDRRRYESAYFWEERNEWFSDLWEIRGEQQALATGDRDRSGAFPFEIPHRLIRMFSVYEDTVLDPFWGTGTTTVAAMVAGRSSVGYERDAGLVEGFDPASVPDLATRVTEGRLEAHREFLEEREGGGEYPADHYDFDVVTNQESGIRLYDIAALDGDGPWTAQYEPV
ncbi:DNA-methyltransferase [Natronomonas sp. EA1]|uniref:DNA-methyltransferase n=1 Tax=Natronomonas sp. EA1 TaxID=3421655 RepID=UPI003EBB811B